MIGLDLAGTFIFAVEGGMTAIGRLDLLGLLIIAFATALGGGIFRDLLLGATPPNAIKDWRYPAVAFAGGGAVLLLHPMVQKIPGHVLVVLDAAGLSLFAVAGAKKALAFKLSPFLAVLMGALTGAGGGVIRDLLLMQLPAVLYTDIYAVAALVGATVMVVGLRLKQDERLMATLGGLACFVLRLVSVWQKWQLPKV